MDQAQEKRILFSEMHEFIGEMCFVCGIRGDKVPDGASISMPRADLLRLAAIKTFFDQIEPYTAQIRQIVVTKGGAIR